jgi:hypothetical protein
MVVRVVMMMVVVTMRSWPDADVNAGAVMVMVMMMSDHDLGGPGRATLRHSLIVGFQQRQGVWDRVKKVAIAVNCREVRLARRGRLSSGHRGEGCGRSQQAGQFLIHSSSRRIFALHSAPEATSRRAGVSSQRPLEELAMTARTWRLDE